MRKRLPNFRSRCKKEALKLQEPEDLENVTDAEREMGYKLFALDNGNHPSNNTVMQRARRLKHRYRFLHSGALSEEVGLTL
jgi:hypothetical protein